MFTDGQQIRAIGHIVFCQVSYKYGRDVRTSLLPQEKVDIKVATASIIYYGTIRNRMYNNMNGQ